MEELNIFINEENKEVKIEQFDCITNDCEMQISYDSVNEPENLITNIKEYYREKLNPFIVRNKKELNFQIKIYSSIFWGLITFEFFIHYLLGKITQKNNKNPNKEGKSYTPNDLIHCLFILFFIPGYIICIKYINIYTQTILDCILCIIISIDIWITSLSYKFIIFIIEDLCIYLIILYLIKLNNQYKSLLI